MNKAVLVFFCVVLVGLYLMFSGDAALVVGKAIDTIEAVMSVLAPIA